MFFGLVFVLMRQDDGFRLIPSVGHLAAIAVNVGTFVDREIHVLNHPPLAAAFTDRAVEAAVSGDPVLNVGCAWIGDAGHRIR